MYHLYGFKIGSGGIFGLLWDLRVWVVCVDSCFLVGGGNIFMRLGYSWCDVGSHEN
jgi:hypothetical protein